MQRNIEFMDFFMSIEMISMLNNNEIILIIMIIIVHIPNQFHNNKVQKMNILRNKMDSFSHRYGML